MRKRLWLTAALALAFILAACGPTTPPSTGGTWDSSTWDAPTTTWQ